MPPIGMQKARCNQAVVLLVVAHLPHLELVAVKNHAVGEAEVAEQASADNEQGGDKGV